MKHGFLSKLIALALLVTLVLGVTAVAVADEDPYTVNMIYLVASEGADQQLVNDAISELAMKDINMKVNLIPMTLGMYESQLPVIMASGEDVDITLILNRFYASFVDSGYIVNMADYLEYAPDAVQLLGDNATAVAMGDFVIGFPNMKELGYPTGLVVRKDIFDELGFSVDDFNVTTDDYSSFDQITKLFAAVKEKYPDMVCLDGVQSMATQTDTYIDHLGNYFGVLENYGQTTTITNWFESDQYRTFCEIAREWYEAGYSSSDIALNTDTGEVKMKAGNCFSFFSVTKPNTAQEKKSQTGYDVVVIPVSKTMKATNSLSLFVYGIANASKNPQKAMEFLNWAYTSKEFNDLINWGIEGKHWIVDANGLAAYPEGVDISTVGYHNDFGWAYPNQFLGHPWEGNSPDIWEQYVAYNNRDDMIVSKAFGFMFDQRPVSEQIAMVNSVYEQYKKDLAFGVVDIDSTLATFNQAMYDAGLQAIMDEKQTQLDEWLATRP